MKFAVARVPETSRCIVEEPHGRIEVNSVVGKGSKFEEALPFRMPPAEVAAS